MTNYSALHHAEVSKRAAEGTDAQAQSIGLEHSAKTYAEQAAASAATANPPPLFKYDWYEYLINDERYLRCDTFSWHPGGTYSNCYDHLVDDIDGVSPSTETVGGYTVTYYQATDGHKICLPDQESTILNIYNATGVAWYYILDTTNTRFKLPRTKYGFVGLRDTVGKYVEAGLPNITGSFYMGKSGSTANGYGISGAFKSATAVGQGNSAATSGSTYQFNFDASSSNPIYGNSSTVQQPATQMYLYCYVGQFSQSATEQTAGLNTELFNGKADLDGQNVVASAGSEFRNISRWSNNVSNCITYIPQDIKLELNNGTLTLKAGSKVYLPDGFEEDGTTPKFSELTIANDIDGTFSWGENYTILIRYENGGIGGSPVGSCYSGSSAVGNNGNFWYDTTNNIFKGYDNGWSVISNCSLPIGIIQCTSGVITAIKQVLNGFGYIGSTVFALPGVKGLIPDGRNEDGTLKNIEVTTSKVLISSGLATSGVFLSENSVSPIQYQYGTKKDCKADYFTIDIENNYIYNPSGTQQTRVFCGDVIESNGRVSNLITKTAFHALDYNDKGTIVSWGIPDYSRTSSASKTVDQVQSVLVDSEIRVIQTGTSNNYNMYYNIVPCKSDGTEITGYCLTSSGGYTGATSGNSMMLKAGSYFKVKSWSAMTNDNSILITPLFGG